MSNNRPLLVIIHGWGFDSGVFKVLVEQLQPHFTVCLIDLPGYGGQSDVSDYSLESLADIIVKQIDEKAVIVAWSMGGLIAIRLATHYPNKVEKLVLLTGTPCFGKKQGWDQAMDRSILENFVISYNKHPKETLNKFSYLASEGSKNPRNWIRELKKRTKIAVTQDALEQGLKLLLDSDLRAELAELKVKTLLILGEKDSLVPVSVKKEIEIINRDIEIRIIKNSGHTPFMTNTVEIVDLIEEHVT